MNLPASPADSLSDAQRPVSIHEPSMFAYATDMKGMGCACGDLCARLHGLLKVKCHLFRLFYKSCQSNFRNSRLTISHISVGLREFLSVVLSSSHIKAASAIVDSRVKAEMRSRDEVEKIGRKSSYLLFMPGGQ